MLFVVAASFSSDRAMADFNIRYSAANLLFLRQKRCFCVPRVVRRRLVYHGLYIRHIQTRVSSSAHHSTLMVNSDTSQKQFSRGRFLIHIKREYSISSPYQSQHHVDKDKVAFQQV